MKRYLLVIFILLAVYSFFSLSKGTCPLFSPKKDKIQEYLIKGNAAGVLGQAMDLLQRRQDNAALLVFEKILEAEPSNIPASWGKAEILRRSRKYAESEKILQELIKKDPGYAPPLISLAYLRYNDGQLQEARKILISLLKNKLLDNENRALVYILLGTVNSRYSVKGNFLSKIAYASNIFRYFLKANELAPCLPETHLALGTFYMKAPGILGGNLDKAIKELQQCLILAPDFATAHARLAQAYEEKGDPVRYELHLERAKALDPQNEVLKEL
ncbi:MAG: tetratricopeptide repeat protein [Candidatus Omnitrophota bacterium]